MASTPDPEGTPVGTPAPTPDSHPRLVGGACTHLRRGRSPAALGVPWALAEAPRGVGGFRRAGTEEPELDIFLEIPREGGRQPGLRRSTSWAQEAFLAVSAASQLLPQLVLVLGSLGGAVPAHEGSGEPVGSRVPLGG